MAFGNVLMHPTPTDLLRQRFPVAIRSPALLSLQRICLQPIFIELRKVHARIHISTFNTIRANSFGRKIILSGNPIAKKRLLKSSVTADIFCLYIARCCGLSLACLRSITSFTGVCKIVHRSALQSGARTADSLFARPWATSTQTDARDKVIDSSWFPICSPL